MPNRTRTASLLECGVATLPLPGQTETGDLHLVVPVEDGMLVAVVDGLGHGEEGAVAARQAIDALREFAEDPPDVLLQHCHSTLRGTRGAVISVARVDVTHGALSWVGVGNVEGVVCPAGRSERAARTRLVPRGGIVGYQLPPLQPIRVPLGPGDVLVFATDGIRDEFADILPQSEPPQKLADRILAKFGKGTDDALVLVARYLGPQ